MPKRILDTNVLINLWWEFSDSPTAGRTIPNMEAWARGLIALEATNAILTPVYIEMVAGVTSSQELRLTRAFLKPFNIADEGKILAQDWDRAREIAQRVPFDKRKRQLGDCLISAIAKRLKSEVVTREKRFPR